MHEPDALAKLPPENIRAIAPYQPGKPIETLERELGITGAIKVASNENPLGPSPLGLAAAHAALAGAHLYPDGAGHRLRAALAERLAVTEDELALGAGSNELIELLVRTFCRPGVDEVLSHRHAFMMYRLAAQAHGVPYRETPVDAELRCDVDALAAAIRPNTRIIFLPNPNNPTGAYVTAAELERLLAKLPPGVILAMDEAYFEYASMIPDYPVAERYRSAARRAIVTLRTFSKAYGLAGLRVGYAVGDPMLMGYLDRVRMPFNTSSVAQEAARAALGDEAHLQASRAANAAGLELVGTGLRGLGVRVYASAANFVLIDLGRDALPVYDALLQRGVITRPLRPAGLPNCLRISIGSVAENRRTLEAVRAVLGA